MSQNEIIKRLDDIGINKAREAMLNGVFGAIGSPKYDIASSWLSLKEKEEADAMSLRAEEREKESLAISRKDSKLTKPANIITIIAVIVTVIIAIVMYLKPD